MRLKNSVREYIFYLYGNKCLCCGKNDTQGIILNVDHIYPKSLYPGRVLDKRNMQILCDKCNQSKSNNFIKDYRYEENNFKSFREDTKNYLISIKPIMDDWKNSIHSISSYDAKLMKSERKSKKKKTDAGSILLPKWDR